MIRDEMAISGFKRLINAFSSPQSLPRSRKLVE